MGDLDSPPVLQKKNLTRHEHRKCEDGDTDAGGLRTSEKASLSDCRCEGRWPGPVLSVWDAVAGCGCLLLL